MCSSAISYRTLVHTLDQAALLSEVHRLLQQQHTSVAQVPTYKTTWSSTSTDVVRSDRKTSRTNQRRINDQRFSSTLDFRSRWLRKTWHFETLRSYGNWTFSLRTWNILDQNASILDIVRQDDLSEFQKRLSHGVNTIDDRDIRGKTLFRVSQPLLGSQDELTRTFKTACEHGSTDILEYLLNCDRRRNELTLNDAFITGKRQQDYKTMFETGVSCYWWASILRAHVKPDFQPAISLLLQNLESNLLISDDDVKPAEYVTWLTGRGGAFLTTWRRQFSEARIQEAVVLLRLLFVPSYRELDLYARLECALAVEYFQYIWLFWHFLDQDELDTECVEAELLQIQNRTILTFCAGLLAKHECNISSMYITEIAVVIRDTILKSS